MGASRILIWKIEGHELGLIIDVVGLVANVTSGYLPLFAYRAGTIHALNSGIGYEAISRFPFSAARIDVARVPGFCCNHCGRSIYLRAVFTFHGKSLLGEAPMAEIVCVSRN